MAISKVIFGGETLIDLTADTVKADKVLKGYTAHGADGEKITGTCNFDADTSDANATDAEILSGKTAFVKGVKVKGTMPNRGFHTLVITEKNGHAVIPQGYHDGSGYATIESLEKAKIIPENIRQGVTILGVSGAMSTTEGENRQEKTVTPSKEQQIVVPDSGYTCLTSVTVKAIPYAESANSAGGTTVTIG